MTRMFSVSAFCADHGVSRSLFYRLIKEGRGPRLTKIARRTLISGEAAAEWRARMERETAQAALPRPPKGAEPFARSPDHGAALRSAERSEAAPNWDIGDLDEETKAVLRRGLEKRASEPVMRSTSPCPAGVAR